MSVFIPQFPWSDQDSCQAWSKNKWRVDRRKVYQYNTPKFVILSGDKDHWLVKKYGFIFPSRQERDRFTSELPLC